MLYTSEREYDSQSCEGVRFRLRKMSFGARLELLRQVQPLVQELEVLQADDSMKSKLQAEEMRLRIEQAYFRWGCVAIEGLEIDGSAPTIDLALERGPEKLVGEVITRVKQEAGLSEEEAKNSASPSSLTT
jgi:hypothetical protein